MMINFVLVFMGQKSWPLGLFYVFNVLPSLTLESYYVWLFFFLIEPYTEDRLSLMDAQCGSLCFRENSHIIFCTYLLELLSKKRKWRRENKKGKTMTAAKTSSLNVKYWVAFNRFYFALACFLVGKDRSHFTKAACSFTFCLSFSPASASCKCERKKKRKLSDLWRYWSAARLLIRVLLEMERGGVGGPSDSLSGWPAGRNGH